MEYTKKFIKYTALILLWAIMLACFIFCGACTLVAILGIVLEGSVQYLLFITIALFCAFMGFVSIDCIDALLDKWHI